MNATEELTFRSAEREVEEHWPSSCWHMVQGKRPADVESAWDWAVTVQALRQSWETPQDAAERIVRLRQALAERWGSTPTMRALRGLA